MVLDTGNFLRICWQHLACLEWTCGCLWKSILTTKFYPWHTAASVAQPHTAHVPAFLPCTSQIPVFLITLYFHTPCVDKRHTVPRLWNALPLTLRQCTFSTTFSKCLKTYVHSRVLNRCANWPTPPPFKKKIIFLKFLFLLISFSLFAVSLSVFHISVTRASYRIAHAWLHYSTSVQTSSSSFNLYIYITDRISQEHPGPPLTWS